MSEHNTGGIRDEIEMLMRTVECGSSALAWLPFGERPVTGLDEAEARVRGGFDGAEEEEGDALGGFVVKAVGRRRAELDLVEVAVSEEAWAAQGCEQVLTFEGALSVDLSRVSSCPDSVVSRPRVSRELAVQVGTPRCSSLFKVS